MAVGVKVLALLCLGLGVASAAPEDRHISLTWHTRTPLRRIRVTYERLSGSGIGGGDVVTAENRLPGWSRSYTLALPEAGTYKVQVLGRAYGFFTGHRTVILYTRIHSVGLLPPKRVSMSDNGVISLYGLGPFVGYRLLITTYNPATGQFDELSSISRRHHLAKLPISVSLDHGHFYVLRLFGLRENSDALPLSSHVENLDPGRSSPYQEESIQLADEDRSGNLAVSVDISLTLPKIESHLADRYDTWVFQYREAKSPKVETLRVGTSHRTLEIKELPYGIYTYELQLMDSSTNTMALAGGVQFYGVVNNTREVSCQKVSHESTNIYLYRWSNELQSFLMVDRKMNVDCSQSPFFFTNLASGMHAHVVEGSITEIIYIHETDSLTTGGNLGYHVVQVPYTRSEIIAMSNMTLHFYIYSTQTQKFGYSYPDRPVLSKPVRELPAIAVYDKRYFYSFVLTGAMNGMEHCLGVSVSPKSDLGVRPYQRNGLTERMLTNIGDDYIIDLPTINPELRGKYDQWKLHTRELMSPVRNYIFTSSSAKTFTIRDIPVGRYELQLILTNSASGAEALAGNCLVYIVGDFALDIPCPANAGELVNIHLFQWFGRLRQWHIRTVLSNVSCNGTAISMRRLPEGYYSYYVSGVGSKKVYANYTRSPPDEEENEEEEEEEAGGQSHVFLQTKYSANDLGLIDSYRADVFRYDPVSGRMSNGYPDEPIARIPVETYPAMVALDPGYFYAVVMYGSTSFLDHCFGLHTVDLSNGDFDLPYQASSLRGVKMLPGTEESGTVTLEVTLPPIEDHLQGKFDTWSLHYRLVSETILRRASAPIAFTTLPIPDLSPGLYEYQLMLLNSVNGREAFAGDCAYHNIGTASLNISCPSQVSEHVDVIVYHWTESEKKWQVIRQRMNQLCSVVPFVFGYLPEGKLSVVILGNITKTLYKQEMVPPGSDAHKTVLLQTAYNLVRSDLKVRVYAYDANSGRFGKMYTSGTVRLSDTDYLPALVNFERGKFYYATVEALAGPVEMCVSGQAVNLLEDGSGSSLVPYQEAGAAQGVHSVNINRMGSVTFSIMMPDVAEHLVGLFDTWLLFYRDVTKPSVLLNQSTPIMASAAMELPSLPVGLYEYQLTLYSSINHHQAYAGSCGLYEVRMVEFECPMNMSELVNVYLYRWSEGEWVLLAVEWNIICRPTVQFPVVMDATYAYIVRGVESGKIYIQRYEPVEGPENCRSVLIDKDPTMDSMVPSLVPESYTVETYTYDSQRGRFGEVLPGKPNRTQEVVTLPALVCGANNGLSYVTVRGLDAMGNSYHVQNAILDSGHGPAPIFFDTIESATVTKSQSGNLELKLQMPSVPASVRSKYDTWKLIYKLATWTHYNVKIQPIKNETMVLDNMMAGLYEYVLLLVNSKTKAEALFIGFQNYNLVSPDSGMSGENSDSPNKTVQVALSTIDVGSVQVHLFVWVLQYYTWHRIHELSALNTGPSSPDHVFDNLDGRQKYGYLVFSVANGTYTVHLQGNEEPIDGQFVGNMGGFSISLPDPFSGIAYATIPPPAPLTSNVLQYRLPDFRTTSLSGFESSTLLLVSNTTYTFSIQRYIHLPPNLFPASPYLEITTPVIDQTSILGCTAP